MGRGGLTLALQLTWAVLLIGFGFGFVTRGPDARRQRLARGLVLGSVLTAPLLLAGTVIGFVQPSGGGLAGIGSLAANFALLVLLFTGGLWLGDELSRRRSRAS